MPQRISADPCRGGQLARREGVSGDGRHRADRQSGGR
jgi:hypothetical protein